MDEWGVAAWMDGTEGPLLDEWAGEWMDVWMDGWVEVSGRVGLRCRHRRLCHRLCHRHHCPVAIRLSTAFLQFSAISGDTAALIALRCREATLRCRGEHGDALASRTR